MPDIESSYEKQEPDPGIYAVSTADEKGVYPDEEEVKTDVHTQLREMLN